MGLNELTQRWIASDNWTYTSAPFAVSPDVCSHAFVDLWLLGVDTAACVTVNAQQRFGACDAQLANMHRLNIIPAKQLLSCGTGATNTLTVSFTGPVPFSALALAQCTGPYCPAPWAGPAPDPIVNNAYIRKQQSSFSWDFAPAVGTSGLWRPALLVGYSTCTLTSMITDTQPAGPIVDGLNQTWILTVRFRAWSSGALDMPATACLNLTDASERLIASVCVGVHIHTQTQTGGYAVAAINVSVPAPQLWYPAGYGAQPLYTASLQLTAGSSISSLSASVGFRSIALEQTDAPGGTLFYYTVNGVDVFARGSNWVPADAYNTRVDDAYVADLLQSAVDVGMNMLRVWGGGVYPSEAFMNAADRLGIMITLDAQFGDQFYSVDDSFLANVAAEMQDAAWQVGSHASLVLYCGNNEMGSGYADRHHLYNDAAYYSQLYFGTVLANLSAVDTSRPMVSTTPSCGNETAAQPFHPNMSTPWKGDIHYYNAFVDYWDVTQLPRPRFITEHGQESWPSFMNLQQYVDPSQWQFNSSVLVARQHHPPGQGLITDVVSRHWWFPNVSTTHTDRYHRLRGAAAQVADQWRTVSSTEQIEAIDAVYRAETLSPAGIVLTDQLWASQVAQAAALRTAVEHWRRCTDEYNETTPGGTRGILYWQLQDTWTAPSWASIEFGVRWKALHYAAARFFAPVLPSTFAVGITDVAQWTNSSGPDPASITVASYISALDPFDATLSAATVEFELWSWSSGLQAAWNVSAALPAGTRAVRAWNASLAQVINMAPAGACAHLPACVLTYRVVSMTPSPRASADGWLYLAPPRLTNTLRNPNLSISNVTALGPDAYGRATFAVDIEAAVLPAVAVWLETPLGGHFSDNDFLMTRSTRTLVWTQHPSRPEPAPNGTVTPGALASSLAIWSLYDVDARYSAY